MYDDDEELHLRHLDHAFLDSDDRPWYRDGDLRKARLRYTFSFVDSEVSGRWDRAVQSSSLVLQFSDVSRPEVLQWERRGKDDPPTGRLKRNDETVVGDVVTFPDALTTGTDLLLSTALAEAADRYEVTEPPAELTNELAEEGWLSRLQSP